MGTSRVGGVPEVRSRLFGREDEIVEVRHLLEDGVRLVTITGAGGIGKIRVALEVCRKTSGQLAFVQLADVGDAGLAGTLMRALVPGRPSGSVPVESIARALVGERWMIVLDTFEHLSGSTSFLGELLEATPDLQLLVTSRSRLRLDGEHVVELNALATAGDGPGVALFCERAKAVGALRDGGDERAVVRAVCTLLGGLPLAIELAAARTTLFTPSALLAALESGEQGRLPMLARGLEDAASRHRDMRSTIAWSYLLLDEHAQQVFCRLATFPGSFDIDTAEQVCGASDSFLDVVARLVDLHLLEPADGPSDAPRFVMLDLLREFALEQLAARGETSSVRERLVDWCLAFGDRAAAGLESADERRWLARVDRELPTLYATLSSLVSAQDARRAARIVSAIGWFWAHRGPMVEGRRWFSEILAVDAARPQLRERERADATAWSERFAIDAGELSLERLRDARELLAIDPDAVTAWLRATEHLAYGLTLGGHLDQADVLMTAGIERAAAEGLPYWSCLFLLRRALSAQRHRDADSAVRFAEEAIRAARMIGYDRVIARAENIVTLAHAAELGPAAARVALLANVRAHEAAGDLRGVASTMASLGAVISSSDVSAAARWYRDGLITARTIGYWHGEAYCIVGVGALLAEVSRFADAARLYGAVRARLPVLQAGTPPDSYAGYLATVEAARSALGSDAFERCAAELSSDWAMVRGTAAALAAELAEPGPPPIPPPRRRHAPHASSSLTERELEVLAAIAAGRSNPQIAADLHLSAKTVMHHSASVYRKLGVRGRAEAVAPAYRTGLLLIPGRT